MLIAHLSDSHFDGTARARERARAVVAAVHDLSGPPDLVVVSGDVTDHGRAEEYAEATQVFAGLDAVFVPGNHDRRAPFRAFLGLPASEEPTTTVRRVGAANVALCDSSVPGAAHGDLDASTRATLLDLVAAPDPLVIVTHHPPVAVHSGLLDPIRLVDVDALAGPLTERTAPTLWLCGHVHSAVAATAWGHPLRIAPGIASTLRLPWEPAGDTLDRSAPPALTFHVLDEAEVVTHVRSVGAAPSEEG